MTNDDEGADRALGAGELERILREVGARAAPAPSAHDEVYAAVEAEWRAVVEARRARSRRWMAPVAAGLAAGLIAIAVFVVRPSPPAAVVASVVRINGTAEVSVAGDADWQPLVTGANLRAGETVRTTSGSRIAIALADGPALRLDAGSRLLLADAGHASLETGALYVDSGPPSSRHASLEIQTARGDITHLGTQYEARIAADTLVVSVREGRVSIDRGPSRIEGTAGDRLTIGHGDALRSTIAANADDWGWTTEIAPPFALEGSTLGEFLQWAGRETGRDVSYANDDTRRAAGQLELHGTVDGLTPEQALEAVRVSTSMRVEIRDDDIRVNGGG